MKVGGLIKSKGYEVIAVDADTPVTIAVLKMLERNIGALLIIEDGKPKGVFTERDALKCYARCPEGAYVREFMVTNLIVARVDDDVSYVSSIMIQNGIRHVPVVEHDGRVVGVLSMRDVVKAQVSTLEAEVRYLKDFITEAG